MKRPFASITALPPRALLSAAPLINGAIYAEVEDPIGCPLSATQLSNWATSLETKMQQNCFASCAQVLSNYQNALNATLAAAQSQFDALGSAVTDALSHQNATISAALYDFLACASVTPTDQTQTVFDTLSSIATNGTVITPQAITPHVNTTTDPSDPAAQMLTALQQLQTIYTRNNDPKFAQSLLPT